MTPLTHELYAELVGDNNRRQYSWSHWFESRPSSDQKNGLDAAMTKRVEKKNHCVACLHPKKIVVGCLSRCKTWTTVWRCSPFDSRPSRSLFGSGTTLVSVSVVASEVGEKKNWNNFLTTPENWKIVSVHCIDCNDNTETTKIPKIIVSTKTSNGCDARMSACRNFWPKAFCANFWIQIRLILSFKNI